MRMLREIRKIRFKRFTFMVIPDANQSVVRFRLNSLVLYVAAFLLLSLLAATAVIYMVNQQNAKLKNQLAIELNKKTAMYKTDLSDKQKTIEKLQGNVIQLSQQTGDMKSKLDELKQLEDDLKSIAKITPKEKPVAIASSGDAATEDASASAPNDMLGGAGGITEAVSEDNIESLAVQTQSSLESMDQDLARLMDSFSDAKQKIMAYKNFLRITPSMWPTISHRITSPYGYRRDPFTGHVGFHDGVDIGASYGDPAYTTADGVVEYTGYDSSHGENIIVRHANGLKTRYLHLSKILVSEGDKVNKGDKIGLIGSTGRSTGPHLHYEVIKSGVIINPMPYTHPPEKGMTDFVQKK